MQFTLSTPILAAALTLAYALLDAVFILLRRKRNKQISLGREACKVLLFFFTALALLLTVYPSFMRGGRIGAAYLSVNLIPFRTIADYVGFALNRTMDIGVVVRNLLGNILLLLPVGLLAPAVWPALRRWWKVLLLGAACSIAIELTQLAEAFLPGIISRSVDIDDVILNTLGVLAGYLLFLLFHKITGRNGQPATGQSEA